MAFSMFAVSVRDSILFRALHIYSALFFINGDLFGTPQDVFNRYVQDYNDKLRNACSASPYLQGRFTTVMEIFGGKACFIDDGLHYSDDTLEAIRAYMQTVSE